MTHSDVRLYPCSTCSKKFRNKFEREVHERLHSGEVSVLSYITSLHEQPARERGIF